MPVSGFSGWPGITTIKPTNPGRFSMRQLSACFLFVLAVLALQPAPAAAQVISVEPMSHDFGEMPQQADRTTTVTVTNDGGAELIIEDVKADCGCTVPTLTKNILAPGESTEIEINFNSKKFTGTVYKSIDILSNDPANPEVEVIIKATVNTPLIVDPASNRVGFTRAMQGQSVTKNVTFTATVAPKLEITAEKSRMGLFQVKTTNNHEGNPKVALLEVTVPADMEPGRHRDYVRVQTNLQDMESVDIEMQAWIAQSITVSPEQVSFRFKKSFRQTVRVAPFEVGMDFKVISAEIDLPEISVEVIETIPNEETKVILEGKPISSSDPRAQDTNGKVQGTLIIHTDRPDAPILKVPVSYMVRL